MNIKSLAIEPIEYNGSVAYFRAWMDVFLSRGGGNAVLQPSVPIEEINKRAFEEHKDSDIISFAQYYPRLMIRYSEIDKSSNREVWYVGLHDPFINNDKNPVKRIATILAVETSPNHTTVEFLDGIYFCYRTPNGTIDYAGTDFIGEEFSSYMEFIKEKWEENFKNGDIKDESVQNKKKPRKRKRKKANQATIDKINRLAEYRQDAINERGSVPGWIDACKTIGIDSRIVINHAKELSEKWGDKKFQWVGFEEK